jgi:hypothetical protein
MVVPFKNDDSGYLKWVLANPTGYVVNVDEPQYSPQYPMVHSATHKSVSSPKRGNYTTGDYLKFCSVSLDALEKWAQAKYGRPLTRCAQCM